MADDWHSGLTEKQRRFVEAFVCETAGNATRAAEIAGYRGSDNQLGVTGLKNLRKDKIQKSINSFKELQEKEGKIVLSPERIQQEWIRLLEAESTTDTNKIRILADAAKAGGMFIERIKDVTETPKKLVIITESDSE